MDFCTGTAHRFPDQEELIYGIKSQIVTAKVSGVRSAININTSRRVKNSTRATKPDKLLIRNFRSYTWRAGPIKLVLKCNQAGDYHETLLDLHTIHLQTAHSKTLFLNHH